MGRGHECVTRPAPGRISVHRTQSLTGLGVVSHSTVQRHLSSQPHRAARSVMNRERCHTSRPY